MKVFGHGIIHGSVIPPDHQMVIREMTSIPAGSNPFLHDAYNMGTSVGSNLTVMFDVHDSQPASYIIVINKTTGERICIDIPKASTLSLVDPNSQEVHDVPETGQK